MDNSYQLLNNTINFDTTLKVIGGTNFTPVFDFITRLDNSLNALVYFTDGLGIFPQSGPHHSVIWFKGGHKIPWGVRCQLQ